MQVWLRHPLPLPCARPVAQALRVAALHVSACHAILGFGLTHMPSLAAGPSTRPVHITPGCAARSNAVERMGLYFGTQTSGTVPASNQASSCCRWCKLPPQRHTSCKVTFRTVNSHTCPDHEKPRHCDTRTKPLLLLLSPTLHSQILASFSLWFSVTPLPDSLILMRMNMNGVNRPCLKGVCARE